MPLKTYKTIRSGFFTSFGESAFPNNMEGYCAIFMENEEKAGQNPAIVDFQDFCKQRLKIAEPGNRYQCLDALSMAIQKKNGGYTEDDRQGWLRILYACLAAPDCYFLQSPVTNINEKRVERFEEKYRQIKQKLEVELTKYSALYTYIDSIRDYMKNPIDKNRKTFSLAEALHKEVRNALKKRTKKYPQYARCNYEETLAKIFDREGEQGRLNHPIFFLFLPYYVFFGLGKCENLIKKDANPFAVPQLNPESLNWSIRNSPLRFYDAESVKKLKELYTLIERALCRALRKQKLYTIGEAVWRASYDHPGDIPAMSAFWGTPISYNDEDPEDEWDSIEEEAVFFSVPFWQYDVWATCFSRVFKLEFNCIKKDLQQLFSLSFRLESDKAEREMTSIYSRYADCWVCSRKNRFCLSDLLTALCTIYNCQNFAVENPFQDQELRNSIDLFSDFMMAIGEWEGVEQCAPDERWLELLRFGYSCTTEISLFDYFDAFIINPSRVLVQTLLLQSIAKNRKGHISEDSSAQESFDNIVFRGDYDRFDTLMQALQNDLYKALNSSQRLFHDVAFWGGIRIVEGKNSQERFSDVVRAWSFWHEHESIVYMQISMYIAKKPACLNGFLKQLGPVCVSPKKLELCFIDPHAAANTMKSKKLDKYKMKVIVALPPKILELLGGLNQRERAKGMATEILVYKNFVESLNKTYGSLDQFFSRLNNACQVCPKIKLQNSSFPGIIESINKKITGELECLDISFFPKGKQEELSRISTEEGSSKYIEAVKEIKAALNELLNFSKWLNECFPNSSNQELTCTPTVRSRHHELFEMLRVISESDSTKQKVLRVKELPKLMQKFLVDLNPLDDFRYAILLCVLFSALRKQMCHQAYELGMKFLPIIRSELPMT